HQLPAGKVEQLLAIPSPTRRKPSASRDLPLASRPLELPHVHLLGASLVEYVGHPPPVRGELAIINKLSLQQLVRLPVAEQWQHPCLENRSPVKPIEDESPIGGPVKNVLILICFKQLFFVACSA